MGALPHTIEQQLRDEIAQRGMVLLELRRRGHTNTTVLEVIVDSEQGITLDEVTELSRWISALMDEAESLIPGKYRLEVSTGGLDRPLEHDWQYRKNIGRLLKLTYDAEEKGRETATFRLTGIDESGLILAPIHTGTKKKKAIESEPITVPMTQVHQAVIEPEF